MVENLDGPRSNCSWHLCGWVSLGTHLPGTLLSEESNHLFIVSSMSTMYRNRRGTKRRRLHRIPNDQTDFVIDKLTPLSIAHGGVTLDPADIARFFFLPRNSKSFACSKGGVSQIVATPGHCLTNPPPSPFPSLLQIVTN